MYMHIYLSIYYVRSQSLAADCSQRVWCFARCRYSGSAAKRPGMMFGQGQRWS